MVSLQAQENPYLKKALYFLTKLEDVDTMQIYQPDKACFSLGLFTTGQKAGFDVDVTFGIGSEETGRFTGLSTYKISEDYCSKLGIEIGYGNASFSYSQELGEQSAWEKNAFSFNMVGRSWGIGVDYFKITNPFISGLTVWDKDGEVIMEDEFSPKELATLRNFAIDGYYIFNNKRFAYPAAYKMGMVQRRTAGSWMVTARYMQGDVINTPESALSSYDLLDCFSTMQASIGGGYSVNFIPWHRDPVGPRDQGLRNININLTAMTVLTAFNYLKTTEYEHDEGGALIGSNDSKEYCYPVPNFIANAATSFTLDRFYLSAQFSYNRFYFRSRDAIKSNTLNIPDVVDDLSFRGFFHDWALKGILVYRF